MALYAEHFVSNFPGAALCHFHVIKSNAKVHDQQGKPITVDKALAYLDSSICYSSYEPERRVMSVSPWSNFTFAIAEAT